MRVWRALFAFLAVATALLGTAEAQWRSAMYLGGSDYEFGGPLIIDRHGNSYFLGQTYSSDMDPAIVPESRGGPKMATFVEGS